MTAPESPELTGEQLRRIRVEELDMTQAELGDRLGLSVNTIARWEQGARAISMPRVVALALVTLIRWHGKTMEALNRGLLSLLGGQRK